MAKQVYVYFRPILVDVDDQVYAALSNDRDAEIAKIVCATKAAELIAKVNPSYKDSMAVMMLENVVKA